MDEHHDIPALVEAQSRAGRQWLQNAHFLDAPEHAATWDKIRKNWVSFLSATSDRPDPTLAPDRKAVRWSSNGRDTSLGDTAARRRFQKDRWRRMIIQSSFWNNLDAAEAMVERWPAVARIALNEADKEQDKQPLETFAAVWDLGRRRRAQAVLSSLVCFLVYATDEDSVEEMGLTLDESQVDNILDIQVQVNVITPAEAQVKSPDVFYGVWAAVQRLLLEALEKKSSTPRNNPLLWWMTILVRSAAAGEEDFISRGRFLHNPMPIDLDISGRVAAMVHYSKVLALDSAFASWNPSRQWLHEVQDELNVVNLEWINRERGGRPDPAADTRQCSSPAWQSVLEHIRRQCRALLGGAQGTAMRKIRMLEATQGKKQDS